MSLLGGALLIGLASATLVGVLGVLGTRLERPRGAASDAPSRISLNAGAAADDPRWTGRRSRPRYAAWFIGCGILGVVLGVSGVFVVQTLMASRAVLPRAGRAAVIDDHDIDPIELLAHDHGGDAGNAGRPQLDTARSPTAQSAAPDSELER